MWVVDGFHQKTESTLQLLDDCLCQICEANGWVLVVDVFGQLGNALGIGLGLESESLCGQEGLEFFVVGDDSIVDDGELPVRIGSGYFG